MIGWLRQGAGLSKDDERLHRATLMMPGVRGLTGLGVARLVSYLIHPASTNVSTQRLDTAFEDGLTGMTALGKFKRGCLPNRRE